MLSFGQMSVPISSVKLSGGVVYHKALRLPAIGIGVQRLAVEEYMFERQPGSIQDKG